MKRPTTSSGATVVSIPSLGFAVRYSLDYATRDRAGTHCGIPLPTAFADMPGRNRVSTAADVVHVPEILSLGDIVES